MFLVLPDIAPLDPFGRIGDGGLALGFDATQFDDAGAVYIDEGVEAVSGVDDVGVVPRATHQSVVPRPTIEGVVTGVADQKVGLAAASHPVVAGAADHEGFADVRGGVQVEETALDEPVGGGGQKLQDDAVFFEAKVLSQPVLEILLPALGVGEAGRYVGAVEADAAGNSGEEFFTVVGA